MKQIPAVVCIAVLFAFLACGTNQVNNDPPKVDNSKNKKTENGFSFEQEGFLSKDHFRVIVIRPFDSTITDPEIEKQVRNKCIVSLKRHITAGGKTLATNADAEILNLINEYGKITPHEDNGGSRTVFVLDIRKPGCRPFVENLGK
jgi:hypothetical protein